MDTTIETTNVALPGDYVIHALSDAGEEYVIKGEKFPRLYRMESATTDGVSQELQDRGFRRYSVVPEVRKAIPVTAEVLRGLKALTTVSQADMLKFVKGRPTVDVQKRAHALARKVETQETIVTLVQKGRAPEFNFVAPWGDTMPVAEGDTLMVSEAEVYRIARAEFLRTYRSAELDLGFQP
jgi:hypothetical protein